MYAFDAVSGALLWRKRHDPTSIQLPAGGVAHVSGASLTSIPDAPHSFLTVAEGVLPTSAAFMLLDPDAPYSSLTVAEGVVYVTRFDHLYALDAAGGEPLWEPTLPIQTRHPDGPARSWPTGSCTSAHPVLPYVPTMRTWAAMYMPWIRGTALALSGAGIRRASNTRCVGARRVRKRKRWTSTHARRRQWGTIVVLQIARALACCANDRGWRRLHSLIQWRCIRFAARGRGIISGLVQADEFLATHTAHH